MAASAAELRSAVQSLYGSAGAAQSAANTWLNAFARSPDAWAACLGLLAPSEPPEVAFFCANMLLSKVRAEWHKLPGDQQAQLSGMISAAFQRFVGVPQAKLALQRLGLLLAAVAALSGAAGAAALAGQCVGMVSGAGGGDGMSECALSMLTALAEEVHNLDKARRAELVAATAPQWADIAALAAGFIPEQLAAGNYGLVHGALLCLQGWLRLSADPGATARLSPGQLAAAHPALLRCLFSLLGATATEAVTAERIECLATELLCEVLGPGTYGTDAAQERAALEAAMGALLALRDAALRPGPAGAGVARAVAAVASALAQRDAEVVCGRAGGGSGGGGGGTANGCGGAAAAHGGGGAHVLPLAELMLHALSRPERGVCEAGVDYFLAVNTLPAEARHPQMLAPLFTSLLGPLLSQHACHPPGFVSWNEELDDDEEAFHRFREQSLGELLESAFMMTGPAFLSAVRDGVASAGSWQAAEGALFGLKAVAAPLKAQLSAPPGRHADAAANGAALQAIMDDLCSPGGRGAGAMGSPHACATAAALVGAYAPWFEATPAAPLEGALRLLLHGLGSPVSAHAAAGGFKLLCVRCAPRLASAPVIAGLAGVAAAAVAPPPPPGQVAGDAALALEDRQAVLDGLARVVTLLPPADATEAALSLQAPHLARGAAIIGHGSATAAGGGAAAKALLLRLADELRLMAGLIRCMEFPGQPPPLPGPAAAAAAVSSQGLPHPAMRLLEAAWPMLSAVAEAPVCRQDRGVVEALCELHKRAVQTARGAAKPLLTTLLGGVAGLFAATQQPACLDVLSTITEVFGEVRGAPDVAAAQQAAFEGSAREAGAILMQRLSAGQPLSGSGDLLRALLALGDAQLVFARALLLGGAALPQLFQWAVAGAALREKEPAGAALGFLAHLLAAAGKACEEAAAAAAVAGGGAPAPGSDGAAAAAAAGALQSCLAEHGERLARVLVLGAADTAPRQLLRALAGVLFQLLQPRVSGDAGRAWLLAALQAQDLPGMAAGLLKPGDCEAFAKCALRSPPLPRGRFDALVMDWGAIARGEGTSDALLAYEL
ncbi:IPO13 [Scenedesmus sp. PABB004]|nr:IPO13 [Scenedesmus sp. PABB004]